MRRTSRSSPPSPGDGRPRRRSWSPPRGRRASTAPLSRGEDIGVHLTLNAELDLYRWAPITQAPSLLDGEGAFPRTVEDVWEHADLDEVRREWRAQIERAVLWGFAVTHLDTHLGGVELKPEFFDVYLDLAEEFRLPVRLPGVDAERRIGFPFRSVAADRAIVAPDQVVALDEARQRLLRRSQRRRPRRCCRPCRVTEVHAHPAVDAPELRDATPDWPTRVREHALLEQIETIVTVAEDAGVEFIAYRELPAAGACKLADDTVVTPPGVTVAQ